MTKRFCPDLSPLRIDGDDSATNINAENARATLFNYKLNSDTQKIANGYFEIQITSERANERTETLTVGPRR